MPNTNRFTRVARLGLTAGAVPAAAAPSGVLAKPAEWYATEPAKQTAANVLTYQADNGGWPKNVNTAAKPFTGDRKTLAPTFDNGATTDELRFLAKMYNATRDDQYKAAFLKGFDYTLAAQYPNGGWPQSFPLRKDYGRHITFNDNSMVRVMEFVREVATADGYAFVPDARKAFDKGVECILKCQIRVNGKLTAWCAQHDEIDFQPRPARKYELVTLSGSESSGIVKLLMSLEKPSPQVVEAVDAAVEWFQAAEIKNLRVNRERTATGRNTTVVADPTAPPVWARFYEIGTNKPIFSDRDGIPRAELADIGDERRNGYAWYGPWPQAVLNDYPAWKKTVQTASR